VNSTERARKSPTSISKLLIPGAQQLVAILFQMANNIANSMGGKPGIDCDAHVMKPEFGFTSAAADMNMRRLAASLE
jgi:hypothetical protein